MFFNNCWGFRCPCRCNQEDNKSTRPCCKCEQEKKYCDIKDRCNYDKCDKRDDRHDKCDYEKKEKCCCHMNFENKCCRHEEDSRFDNKRFDTQNYYCEYNKLGFFGQNNERSYSDNHKSCEKEENNKSYYNNNDFDYGKSYTPNWDKDQDFKYEKNKHDKSDKYNWDNKCTKPVKYICIPCDKD